MIPNLQKQDKMPKSMFPNVHGFLCRNYTYNNNDSLDLQPTTIRFRYCYTVCDSMTFQRNCILRPIKWKEKNREELHTQMIWTKKKTIVCCYDENVAKVILLLAVCLLRPLKGIFFTKTNIEFALHKQTKW